MTRKTLRRMIWLLPGGAVVAYVLLSALAGPAADRAYFREDFDVIAHRGGRGLWPEGTIYAFRRAVEMGADVLEMDVRMTKDGRIVVHHDPDVARTTNGAGEIAEMTLEELQALDAGYRWTDDEGDAFPHRGKGIGIPTLEELFVELPGVRMNIEIKSIDPALPAALARLIREYGREETVLVASMHGSLLKKFRDLLPEAATSAGPNEIRLFYCLSRARSEGLLSPGYEALEVPEFHEGTHVVTERFLEAAHRRNVKVHVWTINDPKEMKRLIDLGVDGVMTDYPDRLVEVLEE